MRKYLSSSKSFIVEHQKVIRVMMIVSGMLLMFFRDLFVQKVDIHETALRTNKFQKLTKIHRKEIFKMSDYKIGNDAYLFRANGQSDFSIILMIQQNYIEKMFEKIYRSFMAHDVLICSSECNVSAYLDFLPKVISKFNLTEQRESTCNISKGTPLDLVKIVTSSMGPFKNIQHVNDDVKINQINIGVPETKFDSLQAVLFSINKMENIFFRGPMMYEIRSENSFVNLSILYIAFLLVIIPYLIQSRDIDFIHLILLSVSYFKSYLSIFAFIYSYMHCKSHETALIPLIGYSLFNFMNKPFQAHEFVYSLGLIYFLPPFGMVILSYRYKFLFPATFSFFLSSLKMKKIFCINL